MAASFLNLTFLLFSGCALLLNPTIAAAGISNGLLICRDAILPSLFPFFVLTELWTKLGYAESLSRLSAPLMEKIFHLPGVSASAVTLGMIGGYPIGARSVVKLYEEHMLSREQAETLLMFCNNAGPAFLIGVMGSGIFHSPFIGFVLYGIHIFSALLVGFLLRSKKNYTTVFFCPMKEHTFSFSAFTDSILSAGNTAIRVCFFILIFSVL